MIWRVCMCKELVTEYPGLCSLTSVIILKCRTVTHSQTVFFFFSNLICCFQYGNCLGSSCDTRFVRHTSQRPHLHSLQIVLSVKEMSFLLVKFYHAWCTKGRNGFAQQHNQSLFSPALEGGSWTLGGEAKKTLQQQCSRGKRCQNAGRTKLRPLGLN